MISYASTCVLGNLSEQRHEYFVSGHLTQAAPELRALAVQVCIHLLLNPMTRIRLLLNLIEKRILISYMSTPRVDDRMTLRTHSIGMR